MKGRLIGGGIGIIAAGGSVVASPLALQHVDFFRLRRIELSGVEYLGAARVLAALQLAPDHNIFASTRAVRTRIEAVPGVLDAGVQRRMPGTLRITVEEQQPVAFVPGPEGLVPIDADAEPLPYDPSVTGFDLPVMPQADPALARTLALVRDTDPALFAEVETAERKAADMLILTLGSRQIVWGAVPSMLEIRAVLAVRRNLEESGRAFDRMDARYPGAVIVRRSPT